MHYCVRWFDLEATFVLQGHVWFQNKAAVLTISAMPQLAAGCAVHEDRIADSCTMLYIGGLPWISVAESAFSGNFRGLET